MKKLWIITKTEFYRYFESPLAYIYLIGFLLLNGSFAFYLGHFFERGQADLISMFAYIPWLYLLFIPAISMRMWAEEFRSKTIMQLISLPVPVYAMVLGKFLASWLFCLFALILTFPFWISINMIGSPDNGIVLSGYIGAWLLAGGMLAISQTMSALTKSQVVALVLAVPANLFFFLSGMELVLGNLRSILSPHLIDLIASFSFLSHFEQMYLGLIEARDILFFMTIIVLFNVFTILIINFRTAGTTWFKSADKGYYVLLFLCFMMIFCGINLFGNIYWRQYQYDFSEDKIYAISQSTRNILANLKGNIYAKIYYSPILGEKNSDVRLLFDKVRLLLKQYAKITDNQIQIKIYYPSPLSDAEDRALAAGLQPLPIIENNSNAYFGLVISDEKDRKIVIPFFPQERKNLLEQDLTEAFYRLQNSKPNLGIISSLPMTDNVIENVATQEWEILKHLEKFYNISIIGEDEKKLPNLDVLLMAHPTMLNPSLEKAIADYSLSGGKILAFFDVATEAENIFAPATREFKPSNYGQLPQLWGIKFIDNAVVADMKNSSFIDATTDYNNNPNFTQDLIQFYIDKYGFNYKSDVTGKLQKIMLTSASVFAPLKDANIDFEPIFSASDDSALLTVRTVYDRISPAVILRNFKSDKYPKVIAAHIKGRSKPLNIIVVGDTDLLYDNFWTKHIQVLNNNYAIPIMDNADFVLNALDVLIGNDALVNLRGKKYWERQFESVVDLRKRAIASFKIKEKQIFDDINRAKIGMNEILTKKTFEERENFTSEELAAIAKIRKQINQSRLDLYNIRNNLNLNTDILRYKLMWVNIYAIPLLLFVILLLPIIKNMFCSYKQHGKLKTNTLLLICGLAGFLVLGSGILVTENQDNIYKEDLEGKPLLSDMHKKINLISKIRLKNSKQELIFFKDKSGTWNLDGYDHLFVYQNRIKSFLGLLLDASYYEKKSAGIEMLAHFGLEPIENDASEATQIELATNSDKTLFSLNVGYYDLDLGRGSKGAYVRFSNNFQIWLAQIDLVDLDLSPNNWTFSSLWNLQWGRFIEVNQNREATLLANLAKELLNTHFEGAMSNGTALSPVLTLNILAEGENKIVINLYQKDSEYFAEYIFEDISRSNLLQKFAQYANGIFYKISNDHMEKIKNAYASLKAANQ